MKIQSDSVEQTLEIGRAIGGLLTGGEVIALIGNLGTGKTHLVKGIALGLGVDEEEVNSPTFTLINEYRGQKELYHIDAYRLERAEQLVQLGFEELCGAMNVVLIEWADRVWEAVGSCEPIRIEILHDGETKRQLEIANAPENWRTLCLDI